jgi:mevalonate kinase
VTDDPRKPQVAIGTAPGKLILFGEHSVVYGQAALGVALAKGVRVQLRRGSGRVEARLGEGLRAPGVDLRATPERLVHAALGDRSKELDTEIEIDLPPLAGLGTSAALAVAVLRAKHALDDVTLDPEAVLDLAIGVEDVAHGKSSGLDPAICLWGGLVEFQRKESTQKPSYKVRRVQPVSSFHLVVGVHGTHGGTAERVRRMAEIRHELPSAFDASMKALGAIAKSGSRALLQGDLEVAGRAMDLAHGVLLGFGLVSEEVDRLTRCARKAGALGAKMSGAGGLGGAFLALPPDFQAAQHIREALEREGAVAWVETAA